jgi:beta-lactamase regulating signal transducer with metallopeptidase domain
MADRFASLLSLFGDEVSIRWLITLLHFLWQGAVVGGVVAIAGRLLRGASARSRYASYSPALLSLPVCVAVTFCVVDVPASLQSSSQLESPADIPARPSALPSQATAITAAVQMETAEATDAPVPSERVVTGAATIKVVADDNSESLSRSSLAMLSRAAPWIVVAYVVGVACFLLRLLTALWGGHRLRTPTARVTDARLLKLIADQADRVKLKCVPVVAYCERVAVPTVLGVLRPMVLLPVPLMTGLTPGDFAAIIRHELAHIRRCHLWMNLLQRVIESLLFFHPVVWFISRQLSAEREVCCDDLVVSSGYEPMHYAGALLRMAELCAISRQSGALALAATGDKTPLLERRIERLMNWGNTPRLQLTRAGMAGLLMTLVSLIVVPGIAHTWAQAQAPGGDSEPNAQSQPIGADNTPAGVRTLREPAFLLPDHWIVMAVGFDNESTELVTASTQSFATIRRWDVDGKKLKSEIKLASDKHGRSFRQGTMMLSADCRRAIAATDQYVGTWETATGRLLKTLPIPKVGVNDSVRLLACTPDLSVIAAGLGTTYNRTTLVYDAHAVVWDAASGKILQTITHKHANDFHSIALSPDGKLLATTNGGGANIWETSTGKLLHGLPSDNPGWESSDPEVINYNYVQSLRFSPGGKQLAIGGTLGVKLVDAQSGELLRRIEAPYRYSSGGTGLVFSNDGQLLARMGTRTGNDKIVPIWSTQTGEMLYELHAESNDGSFSDDGQRFAVGFSDRKMALSVWQLSGSAVDAEQADEPVPESSKDKVAENTHYRGKKAAEFIDNWNPAWGDEQLGIQYGVALTTPQRQFRVGQRVPLAAFFRNLSDKPLQVDHRPDFFWNMPKVVDAKGVVVEFEKLALLGTSPDYRDKLEPGEAYGPFYLGFGLGENPRPGKQNWSPYYKTPVAGRYKLTHTLSIEVAAPDDGDESTSDEWKGGELTSGTIEFEIVDGGGKP